uniref:HEAT repeat-containing protein 1 n=1 Tax=Chelonoidis abingdonii TaxID=106734 RepID=A0A8C0IR19_CHEAB
MTSLAHQLKRLALPQNDPSLLSRSEAASLLFDCKEAASIDRDTFFAIGCTGLEELMGIDPSFEMFHSTLFSLTSKGLERSVQTKAVNEQLDENISSFLIHLSPYFMLKPAQKCLEWLIHRFHIHLYNQDSLIGCVLPYHETKLFVRVIQLLKIEDPTHKWNWLHPIKKPGVPLARGALITHCYKDLGFMDFICSLVTKSVKTFSVHHGSISQLRVLFTFYASTIVSALGAVEKITDTIVSKLLPYIQKGLKSSLVDYRAATYMIICQLAVKVTMETSLVQSLMLQISKNLTKTPSVAREGLACLVVLLQNQKGEGLGKKPFRYLCNIPDLVIILHGISAAYDVTPLLRYLLPHLVCSIIDSATGMHEESEVTDNHIYTRHLEAILTSIPLEKDLDRLLACKFLEEFISYGVENEYILHTAQFLFHNFIQLFALTVQCTFQFLADSDTSLVLSLNHPQPAVRVLAVQHLKEIIEASKEGFDKSFIEAAIFARLMDDNVEVVMAALSALEIFKRQISPEITVSNLLTLFQRLDLSKDRKWYKVLEGAIHILFKEEILNEKEELLNQVVMQLVPFMVITNNNTKSAEWKMAVCLSESGLCSLHPLLKGWPEAFEKVIKSADLMDFVGVANQNMILLFSDNITSGDPSLMLQMVEGLIRVAENESDSVRQKVTAHVISFVLVQCCCKSQMEESYWSLALRIFSLLEGKIRKLDGSHYAEMVPAKWPIESMPGELVSVELLNKYIEKLNAGQAVDVEDSAMLMLLLKSFVSGLKPPVSFLKDETWWNPENLNEQSREYLHLLLWLFDLIVSGASEGADALQFRALLSLLFKVHLEDSEDLFKFLSVLWTYNYNLSNQLNYTVNAMLQTQALYIGCAILTSQAAQKMKQLVSASSPVVISLLINLGSPVSEVRRAALNCLHSLSGTKESPFHPILHNLVQKAEEIITDPVYVTQSLGSLFEELQTQSKQKSQQKKLLEALKHALDCIQAPGCPSYVARSLMKILQQVNGEITKPFFAAVPGGKVQQKLLRVMFDLLLNCKNPLCAQAISSVFKGISVDAEQISVELDPPERDKALATVQQTRRQKIQQKPQVPESVPEISSVNWQRVTLILELLQHKKKVKRPQVLVPALFNLLARCLETSTTEQENMEYTKQLILSCLLNICQKLSPDGSRIQSDILDKEKFNVELVVQCVRVSEMPQTHHHALLLLGTAAGMFPDKVLHNIMPIFTFMGANVMRLDDTYSFQIINKTVKMVIPALIQAEEGGSPEAAQGVEEVVIKIIHVFVDALPHVPEHRRLPILAQLIDTLGGERFLWVLLVLLFEQHVTKTVTAATNGEKDTVLETDIEFWISICCAFSVQHQFQSLMKIIQYLTKLPENKEDDPGPKKLTCKTKTQDEEVQLFNVESHSGKQLRHFKFLSVSFMAQLLASQSFVEKIVECDGAEELQELEQRLLEEVLRYINVVAHSVEENADKPTAKFWRALLNKSYDMLDKVNALLPTQTFIPVIRGLMTNQLPSVRRKAMDLLNNKLQQRTRWQKAQVRQLLELIPELIAIVQRKINEEEEEQAINRQTALFSLKLLCKCFGTDHPEPFVPVLKATVDLISSERKEERNVMGSAFLCIAEVTYTLKALAVPLLPRLMPALLKTLKHKKELVSNEIYLLSAVTALLKVVATLAHFLSPYLLDALLQVVRLEKIAVEMGPSSQLNLRLSSLKTMLATQLGPRVLLPAVTKCYNELANAWKNCLGPLMDILKEHIAVMERDQLLSHQSELTAFFMKALDFRTEHSQDDLEEVGRTETHIISCLISMVMKLSEVSFRPLFFKLYDWSKSEDTSKDRLLTFYRLADCIADKLKGLFSLFAGSLVKPFADTLNQINISKTDEAFFDSENSTEKSCLLLQFILDCLHKIFLFDTQRFVSKERAETLMVPLVDQLENMLGGEENFQERVTMHLIPCIAQFSIAVADDSLWKPLNYQILLKTRHTSPKVRFAALLTLVELAGKLKENYMVLLPESIPFLAELMEDECEEVEHQCQKTIQQLEVILGEPLHSYF